VSTPFSLGSITCRSTTRRQPRGSGVRRPSRSSRTARGRAPRGPGTAVVLVGRYHRIDAVEGDGHLPDHRRHPGGVPQRVQGGRIVVTQSPSNTWTVLVDLKGQQLVYRVEQDTGRIYIDRMHFRTGLPRTAATTTRSWRTSAQRACSSWSTPSARSGRVRTTPWR
jgi:hypothetical protein